MTENEFYVNNFISFLARLYDEQGWRINVARVQILDPVSYSKWVEFDVGSRPCSEGFSPCSLVFLSPQKSTFLNSNSIVNSRATGLSVADCCVLPSLNKQS